ncbi:MAG: DUF1003 domain-containing protein [candidate division SR1 bacterium]|nr:DUF1003 domain-containing protein [candidate division SR1 bacterium]
MSNTEKSASSQSVGQKVADKVAATVGSWKFIIIQSSFILLWLSLNVFLPKQYQWDPYTFTLLNLGLSFQAAYTAPIIMMSQNRQSEIDRKHAKEDYQVNKLAEKEIELIQAQVNDIQARFSQDGETKEMLKAIHAELKSLKKDLKM